MSVLGGKSDLLAGLPVKIHPYRIVPDVLKTLHQSVPGWFSNEGAGATVIKEKDRLDRFSAKADDARSKASTVPCHDDTIQWGFNLRGIPENIATVHKPQLSCDFSQSNNPFFIGSTLILHIA